MSDIPKLNLLNHEIEVLKAQKKLAQETIAQYSKHTQVLLKMLMRCRQKHGEVVTVGEHEKQYAEVASLTHEA